MNKKMVIIISIIGIIVAIICVIIFNNRDKGVKKPNNGKSRYEVNCDKITISVDGKEVIELTGREKKELIAMFNNGAIDDENYDVNQKYDDSYNIKVDFNNFITKLYMRKKDNYVYFFDDGDEQHYRYELKEEVHNKILEYIKN